MYEIFFSVSFDGHFVFRTDIIKSDVEAVKARTALLDAFR